MYFFPCCFSLHAGEKSKVCRKQHLGWEVSQRRRRLSHLLKPVMLFLLPSPSLGIFFQSWPFVEQETSELRTAPGPYSVEWFPFRLSRYLSVGRAPPSFPALKTLCLPLPCPYFFLNTHAHHCQKSPSSAPSPANFLPAFPELDNPRICKNRGKGKARERGGL